MILKCLKLGFTKGKFIGGEARFVFNSPENAPDTPQVAPENGARTALEGVQAEVVKEARKDADTKLDALERRKKVLEALDETEKKALAATDTPKLTERALYKSASKDDFLFVSFLTKFEYIPRGLFSEDGTINYALFAEDTPGANEVGMYKAGDEWLLKKTWGADWMSKDEVLGTTFEQALNNLLDNQDKYKDNVVKKEGNEAKGLGFFDAMAASIDNYTLLSAKTDNDLNFRGSSEQDHGYSELIENSKKVVSYLSASPIGWHKLSGRDIYREAALCGVENFGDTNEYLYLRVGPAIFRKPISGGEIQKMVDVTDGSPKKPKDGEGAFYLDNFEGIFYGNNFKTVSAEDLSKAVGDDLVKNPSTYSAILGESADAQSNPDSVKIEQAKNGLFVGDIDINGNSVDVTGAILENKFKEKITAKFKSRFKFSEDPTTKKLVAEKPEDKWNVDHKDVIVASIVADLVKKLDDWKLANPKTAAATKLDVKVSPIYTVTGTWKDKKGGILPSLAAGVEVVVEAEQKVAKFLGSKIGQLMLMFGLIDEKKLINHFKGSPKIPGFEIFAFFAGVGDSKKMDNMAKKHGWLAKLKAKVDGLVAKASEMVGIEGTTEAAKVFTSGLVALSGPLTEPVILDTQAGDIFGGTVLTANVDFTLNRLVTCRRIGETDWREVQLSNANGYQVRVNQALDDITIPVGVVVGLEAPQAVAAAEETPAEATVVEATVDPTDSPADAPAETQEA